MKIYAIRDESVQEQKDLAYLLYYGREKQFYIELPENADAWETPLLLDSFVKRGETTVNSYWSKIWVQPGSFRSTARTSVRFCATII